MSRHRRSRPGEGPYPYKERKLYYATCSIHGTRYQSFYQRNIRIEACGKCRREANKISPGQLELVEMSVGKADATGPERILHGTSKIKKGKAVEIGYRSVKVPKRKKRPAFLNTPRRRS